MVKSTERFSSRVDNYVRYRPSYPAAAIELLQRRCGLNPRAVVADLGSGTGILTRLLLPCAAQVAAVEPNEPMRAAAEAALAGDARFVSVQGTAEATTLAAASIDLVVAGPGVPLVQGGPCACRGAAHRARRGAYGALLWNEHPVSGSPSSPTTSACCAAHASEYDAVVGSRVDEAAMREYLGAAMQCATLPQPAELRLRGAGGAAACHPPMPPSPAIRQHEPLLAGLAQHLRRAPAGRA